MLFLGKIKTILDIHNAKTSGWNMMSWHNEPAASPVQQRSPLASFSATSLQSRWKNDRQSGDNTLNDTHPLTHIP